MRPRGGIKLPRKREYSERGDWAETNALGVGGERGDRAGGIREVGGDPGGDRDQKGREGTESMGGRAI